MTIPKSGPARGHENLIVSNISYSNDDNGALEMPSVPVVMMMVAMMVIMIALCSLPPQHKHTNTHTTMHKAH